MRTQKIRTFLFWFVILIVFSLRLILAPDTTEANEKGMLWFGFGEAEGKYQEENYGIDKEVRGDTWEYSEYQYFSKKNNGSLIPSSQGASRSFFVHYTLFDPEADDKDGVKHKLNFTEVIPNWSRGYTYTIHLTDEIDLLTSADIFLGLGIITFEKEIETGEKYDYKFGYDLSYGWSLQASFKFDDNLFFGWRSFQKNNSITLQYEESGKNNGYLTHRRDIILFIGGTFSGARPTCVETLYTKC